jgi:hypothetical protein
MPEKLVWVELWCRFCWCEEMGAGGNRLRNSAGFLGSSKSGRNVEKNGERGWESVWRTRKGGVSAWSVGHEDGRTCHD